ncbi:MAG: NYN domain-containing protein [Chloroflexi bacterium]|nr:NYN domain-containing protein [Chloroflexota bacterium]
MPHLIDGHNLIPHTGLKLADPNDEGKLTAMLLRYFARTGRSGTVYFDGKASGAPAGGSSRHLTVRFVAAPRTADDAIRAHLARLGAEARNWVVVSNDQAVRQAATRAGARAVTSSDFARDLRSAASPAADEKPEGGLTPDELDEFERLFRDRPS